MFSRKSYSPLSYFPEVWFVEDETTVPQELLWPKMVEGSCGGAGYDNRKEKRRKRKMLEQEEDDIEEIMLVIQCFLGAQSLSGQ